MNNSLTIEDFSEKEPNLSQKDQLVERESKLVRLIESFKAIEESREWSTLRELMFDGRVDTLENQLKSESKKTKLDNAEMYRLQGRIAEAKRYMSPLTTLRLELNNIRKQINPPTAGE